MNLKDIFKGSPKAGVDSEINTSPEAMQEIKALKANISSDLYRIEDTRDDLWQTGIDFMGKGAAIIAGSNPHTKSVMQTLGIVGMAFTMAVTAHRKNKVIARISEGMEENERRLASLLLGNKATEKVENVSGRVAMKAFSKVPAPSISTISH